MGLGTKTAGSGARAERLSRAPHATDCGRPCLIPAMLAVETDDGAVWAFKPVESFHLRADMFVVECMWHPTWVRN